ncbi:homoserine acetyltransferase [Punctularia strigosozonata HHB-11173 SS5]|uniref:Homoserine acetyltransferase n=1 Tax=Punctularia strigosozonata (strain HHB-11173) TaxID=741275 RepID=R7S1X6_PUNST|nr:homoserine acetyltransferase [Punctularia strigosozonata HHB-11173 SS5]EIN04213.1 homoserine acetyltransferase [Punctularia strigosozonata HHB-11173 SS5]
MSEPATQYYHHGRFKFAGGTLPNAITAYRTEHAVPPLSSCPWHAETTSPGQAYLVGQGKALDTTKYFVVTFALFSNGESSSPSNTPVPYNGPYFPHVSYEDNIRAQYAVLTKKLGVQTLHMVVGFSMGGQQAYYWATVYPEFVERFVCICGSARTSPHNKCFLEGPKAALVASKDFEGGHYTSPPQHGIRAFGRVYSAWAYGQTWFREQQYLHVGGENTYPDMETWMRENWEGRFLARWDANDMLTLLKTWQTGDISLVRDGGDYPKALAAIKAKGLVMPGKTDLYFPPEDSEIEISHMTNGAKLAVIDTVWGHFAGGGSNTKDTDFITAQIKQFLEETS